MPEIDTDKIYKQLKKQNGEGVAKVIRDAVLLDVPNIVHILEFAGNNPDNAQKLVPVLREIYKKQQDSQYHTDKNPLELLNDAGYDAFVVKTEEQKDSIKKYFRPNEELCTFRDPKRHIDYYMIHAIKRGADKIKPFDYPDRQDEYGTSVISIQIAKSGGFISIKNRYNHTVLNPDNTFNSNPDKIIPGLANSLKKYFHVNFNSLESEMPDNFRMINNQLVRYNYEINNVYFGPDYYFSGSEITKLNNDYELMLDCFVLNTRDGKLENPAQLNRWSNPSDDTYDALNDFLKGKKIKIEYNPENKKEKIVFADGKKVLAVIDGQMTELIWPGIKKTEPNFLTFAYGLKKLSMPDVQNIADNFLIGNTVLDSLYMPKLQTTGKDFLTGNRNLTELNLPELTKMGPYSLQNNHNMESIYLPKFYGDYIAYLIPTQPNLKQFYAPNLHPTMQNEFARNNINVAMQIARTRVQQKIDEMTNTAKEKLNKHIESITSQNMAE